MTSLDKIIPTKNKRYLSPIRTEKESESSLTKDNINNNNSKKKDKLNLKMAIINSTVKNNFNTPNTKTKRISPIRLPILDSNNISAYSKRKQYKVFLPKHRDKKEIPLEEQEERVTRLLNKYADSNKNKHLFNDDISRRYNFDRYIKLQSVADIKFKPRLGDTSQLLVNYIEKVSKIRKQMIGNVLDEINNAENRYNLEKPKVDFNFKSRDKNLIDNRWKNTFSLDEYQRFFSRNLKDKISSMSYLKMIQNFKQISLICFSEGNSSRSAIKRLSKI
jgi:hypothetical protein